MKHTRPVTKDAGQITGFVVAIFGALILLAGLVIDGGLALATKVRALNVAQEAARTGAQQLDLVAYRTSGDLRLDPVRARSASASYIARAGDTGTAAVSGDRVIVTVRAVQGTQILRIAGVRSIRVEASAIAVARRGIERPLP